MGRITRPRYYKKKKRAQTNRTGNKTKFSQGIFIPENTEKYKQPYDSYMNKSQYPEYRSSWELKFFKFLDKNSDVEYWTSEPFAISYMSPKDGKIHRYFPDVLVKFKNGKKLLVEIKPDYQTSDPINLAKWESAKNFCQQYGLEFIVLTENNFKKFKS